MSDHQQQTEEWYRSYHTRRGKDRNNILANAGVLFQFEQRRNLLLRHFDEFR